MTYLTCPLCGEDDYDRVGLALHYEDCHVAQALASEERQRKRVWEFEHAQKLKQKEISERHT